jgi:hypothetical protein
MNKSRSSIIIVAALAASLMTACVRNGAAPRNLKIFRPEQSSPRQALAAREIRRYFYLRTGSLIPVVATDRIPAGAAGFAIARKDDSRFLEAVDEPTRKAVGGLGPEGYLLRTAVRDGRKLLLVAGGDDAGTLYGAYKVAEHLGVRFGLHDDIIPDGTIPPEIPVLDETARPLFPLRGIQLFPDFPEGPDWWSEDDTKAVLAQLPKMGMDFIGIHSFPEGQPNAEPVVWTGLAEDVEPNGRVKFSYPSSFQNTRRGNWGYAARPTSQFAYGAGQMFDRDDYGSDLMLDQCPEPKTPEESNLVFNRAGEMLGRSFEFGRALGVKTSVGPETPLTIPKALVARLKSLGLDPKDPAVIQRVYEGVFTRIMKAYPLDYLEFWTPEGWTWAGTNRDQVKATYADVDSALAALKKVGAPFPLVMCGWVLGPQYDRAEFDRVLPKEVGLSCINRQLGTAPVETGFGYVTGREKWAMAWLEDDPGLTIPQLWAGRMRRNAVDAMKYGCSGLMGIFWRTRVLAPNALALARAAWDQSGFDKAKVEEFGPMGGTTAAAPDAKIEGTPDEPLYRTGRVGGRGYQVPVPNGRYRVTLRFCEPFVDRAGVRAFDVALNGVTVIPNLDIFARAGRNRALDFSFDGIEVKYGHLDIDFNYLAVGFPIISAFAIEGPGFVKKINCGGPAYKDYEAEPEAASDHYPSGDLYRDWAVAEFGPEKGPAIAGIFTRLDGRVPRPVEWFNGPGGIDPDPTPWDVVKKEYAFVDELAKLRPAGKGSAERFDFWLETFENLRHQARLRCVYGEYDEAMRRVKSEKDPEARKRRTADVVLPIRKRLIEGLAPIYANILNYAANMGEIGSIANWDQHVQNVMLNKTAGELEKALGGPLPEEYRRPPTAAPGGGIHRIIVPTLRNCLAEGEPLRLKVIILGQEAPDVTLFWKRLGSGGFKAVSGRHVARGVHQVELSAEEFREDFEYYVEARDAAGEILRFPVTAPETPRTVVVMPGKAQSTS